MHLKYYRNLDGVRGIAALMIVVFHFFQGVTPNSAITAYLVKLSVLGHTGVTLFFVLSGFLITRILMSTKEQNNYFSNFYTRRALRIFPLYYFFLIVYYFVLSPLLYERPVPFAQQWYYYVYLQNFATTFHWTATGPGHFWSLAVEEHFYLFWPLLVFMLSTRGLVRVVALVIVSAVVLTVILLNNGYTGYYFTFTRIDALAIGALLAVLEYRGKLVKENARFALIAFVIILIPTVAVWTYFSGTSNFFIQAIRDPLEASIYFSLIAYVICISQDHPINRLLASASFQFTGKVSYGIYVYHPLAFSLVHKYLPGGSLIVGFIEGVVATYLIATLSYYLLESRFLKLKKYFKYG